MSNPNTRIEKVEKAPLETEGALSRHVQNIIGDVVWEGKPNPAVFLLDWMELFLIASGGVFGLMGLLSIGWWWGAVSANTSWDLRAILQLFLGPLSIVTLLALAVYIPWQLFRANRAALARLRYVVGANGFSIIIDGNSFSLPYDKAHQVKVPRPSWLPSYRTVEIMSNADWKGSNVYHRINESFSLSRVTDHPALFFLPSDIAKQVVEKSSKS